MHVIPLQEQMDSEAVGAKAANLGRVLAMGLDVPPGIALTRQALGLFLAESGLLGRAKQLLTDTRIEKTERARLYKALCADVLAAPIPPPVVEATTPLAQALLDEAPYGLAVRSSGAGEDSAAASFAGVYDSFLGVPDLDGLWDAVRRCWCATWSPHAVDYARRLAVPLAADGMGVLVQRLVPADSAGVLFTVDPRNGNPWQFTLESSWGLARDLVDSTGAVSVDRFSFAWDTGEIIQRHVAQKHKALLAGANGPAEAAVPAARQNSASISDETARRVAQIGLQLDRAFNTRVDIEWAFEGHTVHIVQVRPVTALPTFFPHRLPPHLADRTWRPAERWHFAFAGPKSSVTPPLYRDYFIIEKFNRYLQIGPREMPAHRKVGAEQDFNAHRYLVEDEPWPQMTPSQEEAYLEAWEPQMRHAYLEDMYTRFPAAQTKAARLLDQVDSPAQAIDALLWAREEMWEFYAITAGPSQAMFADTQNLLRGFAEEHLSGTSIDDLLLGYHPQLAPYYPQVLMEEAENLADLLGTERQRFARLDLSGTIRALMAGDAPPPFIKALEEHCTRFGLLPPSQFESDPDEERSHETVPILRLLRNALKGGRRAGQTNREAVARREAAVDGMRHALADRPDLVPRFERLHDWALFWGPALNNRAWANVTGRALGRLFRAMRRFLVQAGLVDRDEDLGYFTAEDLISIAATGDIAAGRALWRRRRLEHEHWDRLDAPAFLGKAPAEGGREGDRPQTAAAEGSAIVGKPGGPGLSRGIVRRIGSLEEGDEAGEGEVAVLTRPLQANASQVPFLFSLMLRVRGLVVPDHPTMWMHHVGQIARECRVPIVRVGEGDLQRLHDGIEVEVDGTRGELSLLPEKSTD